MQVGKIIIHNLFILLLISVLWLLPDASAAAITAAPDSVAAAYNKIQSPNPDSAALDSILTNKELAEVVVTAREGRFTSSTSLIDSMAMKHLQPSSFTDLLELLPGNVTKDPDMGSVNRIALRQAVNITPSNDYATSALGTSFVVDGVPMASSSVMTATPDSDQSGRMAVGVGVDMRAIATDDIDHVEIVRGIPSVEYGELTSGLVKIKRKSGATRIEARFNADNQSQLFSLGKGFAMPVEGWIMNVNLNYLDSKIDPRNNRENFRRIGGSIRSDLHRGSSVINLHWNSSLTYSGIIEHDNNDPDLTVNNTIDRFSKENHNFSFNNTLNISPVENRLFQDGAFTLGVNYQNDRLHQQKHVAPSRVMPMPVSLTAGDNYVGYLPMLYLSDYDVFGKPLDVFAKISARFRYIGSSVTDEWKVGAEWTLSKNLGEGPVYDINRPLTAGNNARPRKFSDVPALNQLSAYAENSLKIRLSDHTLALTAGLRETQLVGLSSRFALSGKPYIDERVNLVWVPAASYVNDYPVTYEVVAGYGRHTKMPVAAYLFPDLYYSDLEQLNYYHSNADYRAMNVRTYIEDLTNYDLRAARNLKWEIRGDISYRGNRLSVTYFRENMNDGFRYANDVHRYIYNRYDASGYDSTISGAPVIDILPYQTMAHVATRQQIKNGSQTSKSGIEYTFQSKRFPVVRTRLTVSGAYLRTVNSSSCDIWYKPSIIVNNRELQYVGLYDDRDGSVYESCNTNFLFDTDIPSLKLNFSIGIQNMWFTSRRTLYRDGAPTHYVDADLTLHEFNADCLNDPYLRQLLRNYSSAAFDKQTIPVATTINLKATKTFWHERVGLALYVNRLFAFEPDYERYGVTIRRYSSPYFGMEINLKL